MAIQPLQLPPIISGPQVDFSALGSIGPTIHDAMMRQQAPGLVAGAFGAQPPQAAAPQAAATPGVPLNALGQGTKAQSSGLDPNAVYGGLVQRGLSPTAAAGITGNLHGESALNPTSLGDGGTSFGLAQWRGSRLDGLKQFAAQNGKDISDPNVQLDYLVQELKGPEARAFAGLQSAQTPADAATAFMTQYERPAAWAAAQSGPGRAAFASQVAQSGGSSAIPPSAQPAQYQPQGQGAPSAQPQGSQPQPAMPGLSPEMAQKVGAMLANPYTAKLGEALLQKYAAPSYGFQTLPDGTVMRTDALHGTVTPVYQSTKPQFTVIAKDQYGNDVHGFVDPTTRRVFDLQGRPVDPNAMPNAQGGTQQPMGDLHGDDFLKTLQPGQAATVKGIVEGRIPFPTGFVMKTPYGQWLVNAIGQYEPGVDANVIAQRKKLQTDLSASSPNSMGGILSNGKSAFEHLAELSDKAVTLGSVNGPDLPGGSVIAHAENKIGSVMGTSATAAKIGAFNQNALKYGQESTKFYAGTGGGEAERMNALKSLDPTSSSGQEQAAFLENEKGLMLDRLNQKEAQVKGIMGDAYLAKHPIITPELQQTIAKIDANIAKLRGQAPAPQQAAQQTSTQPTKPSAPTFGSPQDVYAAMKSGKLKSGDQFMTPDGQLRTVK